MLTRIHGLLFGIAAIFIAVSGFYYIRSIFDTTAPIIKVSGVIPDNWYSGDIHCNIAGQDGYKIDDISIWLDDKAIVNHYKINKSVFDHNFSIGTQTLPAGKHLLKISVQDASSRKNTANQEIPFWVDNEALHAAFVRRDNDFKVFQGHTLHIQFQTNKEIKEAFIETLSHTYPCVAETANSSIYECFVPIKCEEPAQENLFRVHISDKVGNRTTLENKFHVVMFPFKTQKLAIGQEKMKEEGERGLPEAQLEATLLELTNKSPHKKLWNGVFDVPVEARGISTDFGTLRTSQERGKYRHAALDLLGIPKTVIWAPQDGIIVLKERYAHSGNTVVIDHGCGVLSLFYHLDNFGPIQVGDFIKKGKPIGTLGKTGYASGYHLHWEMRIGNTQVHPMQWAKNF